MATEKAEKGKKLMSKQAARAAAEKEAAAKKSSNPAKKKPAAKTPKPKPAPKGKKPAKAKTPKPLRNSTALVTTIPPAELDALNRDADANVKRLQEMIPEHVVRGAEIYNVMEDHRARELWKFGSTPYKSWDAFLGHYAELAKISKRTLEAVVSSNKFLPGVSAETKKAAGPRKVKKLVAAAKKHKKKTGKDLPPEIIDAAVKQPEKQFDETLRAADLAPEKSEPVQHSAKFWDGPQADPDPLLHHEAKEQPFRRGKNGGSGAIEGKRGTAQKFASVIAEAVEMAYLIYTPEQMGLADGDEAEDEDVLRFIVGQWKKFPCARPGMEDMTHEQCAEHIEKAK